MTRRRCREVQGRKRRYWRRCKHLRDYNVSEWERGIDRIFDELVPSLFLPWTRKTLFSPPWPRTLTSVYCLLSTAGFDSAPCLIRSLSQTSSFRSCSNTRSI